MNTSQLDAQSLLGELIEVQIKSQSLSQYLPRPVGDPGVRIVVVQVSRHGGKSRLCSIEPF